MYYVDEKITVFESFGHWNFLQLRKSLEINEACCFLLKIFPVRLESWKLTRRKLSSVTPRSESTEVAAEGDQTSKAEIGMEFEVGSNASKVCQTLCRLYQKVAFSHPIMLSS